MPGYLDRFIHLEFPDLAGVDDNGRAYCWVKIRNPRLMPAGDLLGAATVPLDDSGHPVDSKAAGDASFVMASKLIIAGRVWDPTWVPNFDDNGDPVDDGSEAPLLPMPPSIQDVQKFPTEIFGRISEEVKKATPR
jgi:hypothetical protein